MEGRGTEVINQEKLLASQPHNPLGFGNAKDLNHKLGSNHMYSETSTSIFIVFCVLSLSYSYEMATSEPPTNIFLRYRFLGLTPHLTQSGFLGVEPE
jgi:hypothetical protein